MPIEEEARKCGQHKQRQINWEYIEKILKKQNSNNEIKQ